MDEPATLQQRWTIWRSEFELFCAASGIKDAKQKRALLLHIAGTGIREIFRSIPDEKRGEDKDYKKAMDALTEHFQLKRNISQSRQTFLTAEPKPGERIHNFVTRLQTLAEDCDYNDEKDNQIRDRALIFITDKHLKAKLYRDNDLTLSKLLEIVSSYHDKDALVLIPTNPINTIQTPRASPTKFQGGVTNATKSGTWHGIVVVAKTIHVPNVAKLVILKSVVKLNQLTLNIPRRTRDKTLPRNNLTASTP